MTAATNVESDVRPAASRSSRDGQLDPRNNSLNLLRLVLALAVLVSHSFPIGGFGPGPVWAGENLGGWAVVGFFLISGYLIAGSRLRSRGGQFLVNRIARIFPAFWLSLIAVAAGFALFGYWYERGTVDGYATTPNTPLNFVVANGLLKIADYSVAGTLQQAPLAGSWNGSLWTLYFEFLSYLLVGVLLTFGFMRRSVWPMAVVFLMSVAARATYPTWGVYVGGNMDVDLFLKLVPFFLGGALLLMVKDRIRLVWWGAALAAAASVALVSFSNYWGGHLAAPLLAYVIFWVGKTLPAPRLVQVHDISYGVYVYAWPSTQLMVLLGVHEHGVLALIGASTLLTLPLATASWLFLEKPVMEWVKRRRRTAALGEAPTGSGEPASPEPAGVPAGSR
ncbi:acyltransferase family protein [Georgenia sp. AZ-5]|uniref:acyltransferase family protein n=1 Tax=Georgenia sp. AZ-5 TaxID=3367526 RepID=UPI0037544B9A